jgi:hypothetical protein
MKNQGQGVRCKHKYYRCPNCDKLILFRDEVGLHEYECQPTDTVKPVTIPDKEDSKPDKDDNETRLKPSHYQEGMKMDKDEVQHWEKLLEKIVGGYCWSRDGGNGGYTWEYVIDFIRSLQAESYQKGVLDERARIVNKAEEAVRSLLYWIYQYEADLSKDQRRELHELGGAYTDTLLKQFTNELKDKLTTGEEED